MRAERCLSKRTTAVVVAGPRRLEQRQRGAPALRGVGLCRCANGRQLLARHSHRSPRSPLASQVMTGAFIFAADLVRGLRIDGLEIGSVRASSYVGAGSSGEVSVSELSSEVAGKHVLLVEDIVDTGLTLSKLSELLLQQGAASVKVVTLLDKKAKRKVALVPDFSGFDCPDSFVVGYGLDYDGKLRGASAVHARSRVTQRMCRASLCRRAETRDLLVTCSQRAQHRAMRRRPLGTERADDEGRPFFVILGIPLLSTSWVFLPCEWFDKGCARISSCASLRRILPSNSVTLYRGMYGLQQRQGKIVFFLSFRTYRTVRYYYFCSWPTFHPVARRAPHLRREHPAELTVVHCMRVSFPLRALPPLQVVPFLLALLACSGARAAALGAASCDAFAPGARVVRTGAVNAPIVQPPSPHGPPASGAWSPPDAADSSAIGTVRTRVARPARRSVLSHKETHPFESRRFSGTARVS